MPQTGTSARPLFPAGMTSAVAVVGAAAIGAALFEAVLVPGLLIGGAVVLAPRLLPGLRRRFSTRRPATEASLATRFGLRQAVVKTITFRVIVTSLDFTTNYLIIGQVATAAGISAFGLVAGPVFYLLHEALWTRYGPEGRRGAGSGVNRIDLPMAIPALPSSGAPGKGLTVDRATAKTITFSLFAVSMGFTVNYVAVQDLGTALLLTATGLVIGPTVYYFHERAWDSYNAARPTAQAAVPALAAVS